VAPARSADEDAPLAEQSAESTAKKGDPHALLPTLATEAADPAEKRRRMIAALIKWTKRGAALGLFAAVLGCVSAYFVVRHYEEDLPSVSDLKTYKPSQTTRVVARDGTLLQELFIERRTVVRVQELPPQAKLAFLAAEDANFYEHQGLNYPGIARAMLVNLRSGKTRQGGSTITQQVVKNMLLDSERTFKRKVREMLLARRLEQELSKDEILELYLNHIYFGHGRYGIEEAARDNFGKSARELTIAEAALLAGIPKGPEIYSPRRDLNAATTRRAFVLEQMLAKGFLNDAQ
jgi:penicillin-binding protein 1A